MFIEKEHDVLDTISTFKKAKDLATGVKVFKRKINGKNIMFAYGMEKIAKEDQPEFLQAISMEFGDGKIEEAEARFLAADNETWFDVVQRARKDSGSVFGQYVACTPWHKDIASLSYVGRRALISGKTEFLVSVSSQDAPAGVYDQLLKAFVNGVVLPVNNAEHNVDRGLTMFINSEEYNTQSKELVKNVIQNPKVYGCKHGGYFGQNEEDYKESVYYCETMPAAQEVKKESFEQIKVA